jgi:hypothetical protein
MSKAKRRIKSERGSSAPPFVVRLSFLQFSFSPSSLARYPLIGQ